MEMLREQRKQLQLLEGGLKWVRRLLHKPVALAGRQRRSRVPAGLRLPQLALPERL